MTGEPKKLELVTRECQSCAHYTSLEEYMQAKFSDWSLTASEKDIAFMLVQGLSLRAVAQARETSESTVRLQALSIYSKAQLEGRHDLSAYFIKELLGKPKITIPKC